MKSYTDIEQSKKLAEILPKESADMCYLPTHIGDEHHFIASLSPYSVCTKMAEVSIEYCTPCWSLAALLEEIPSTIVNNVGEDLRLHIDKDNLQYYLFYENEYTGDMFEIETELYNDMVDACYEIILKLHELKLL